MSAYRSMPRSGGPTEHICLRRPTPWWVLLACLPLLLSFLLLPTRFCCVRHPDTDTGACVSDADTLPGCTWEAEPAYARPTRLIVRIVAVIAISFVALSWLGRRGTDIVVDRRAKVIKISGTSDGTLSFDDMPTLVLRDDEYFLHARNEAPIFVATTRAPHEGLRRLRESLATLNLVSETQK